MDYDFGVPSDDLVKLEERQDLSQYSYDPNDTMDLVNSDIQLPCESSFQLSSQEKLFDADDLFSECDQNSPDGMFDGLELKFEQFSSNVEPADQLVLDSKSCIDQQTVHALGFVDDEVGFDVTSPTISTLSPDSTSTGTYFNLEPCELESSESLPVSDKELLSLSTRELNRQIRHLSTAKQQQIKNRRRTLKNRGYAQTCRTRRIGQRNQLECDKDFLGEEVKKLREDKDKLVAECDRLRKEGAQYKAERDIYQYQLQGLVDLLAANGYQYQVQESD